MLTQPTVTQARTPYHELGGAATLRLERLADRLGVPLDEAVDLALDFLDHEASQAVDTGARWGLPAPLSDFTDMQTAILEVLAERPRHGQELAKLAGYAEKSLHRGGVEPQGDLRAKGLVKLTTRGYELTHLGRQVIAQQ